MRIRLRTIYMSTEQPASSWFAAHLQIRKSYIEIYTFFRVKRPKTFNIVLLLMRVVNNACTYTIKTENSYPMPVSIYGFYTNVYMYSWYGTAYIRIYTALFTLLNRSPLPFYLDSNSANWRANASCRHDKMFTQLNSFFFLLLIERLKLDYWNMSTYILPFFRFNTFVSYPII